jgi:DNA-binding HxlR family transcriptional regulator
LLAASRSLSVFTSALSARVLYAFAEGPRTSGELEETLGWAPQSSLRASIANLTELGALVRISSEQRAHGARLELTDAGREFLPVAAALERWLADSPAGPISIEDPAAQGIVRTLTAGWDSTIVRVLAERPQSLIELSATISALNYPTLKRRLAKLRSTHLVIPVQTASGRAYEASEWLRRAVVPLTMAGRWERRHDAGQPIASTEVEAAFMLALPLTRLPARASGACGLAVLTSEERKSPKRDVAGVALEVSEGEIVSCSAEAAGDQPTWALGTVNAWLEALVDGRSDALRVSGDKPRLATGLIKALHADLFRAYDTGSASPSAQAKATKTSR